MDPIRFIQVRPVKKPERAHDTDSGIDFFIPDSFEGSKLTPLNLKQNIYVDDNGHLHLPGGQWVLIPSGIKMIIPEGFDMVFENKSGVSSKHNLIIGAKVVDSSYRGEVHIHVINASTYWVLLDPWMKIVQGIVRKVEFPKLIEITPEEFIDLEDTARGTGWFGSTGQ